MSDPSSASYAEGVRVQRATFDQAALITDTGERVLHCADEMLRWHADQIAKAVVAGAEPATVGMTPSTWTFVERSRNRFAQLLAMLKDPDLSEKDRREATDEAIWLAFMIGETKGQLGQTLHGRADRKRAQAELMRAGRTRRAEARLDRVREIIRKTGWDLDGDGLDQRLAERLGVEERTGKLVPLSTVRADLSILRAERSTNSAA